MDAVSVTLLFLGLFSGIALFLYGMSVMGDGLKKVAGNKLETLLYGLTSTPLKGILLGAGVTAIIQSSSATSVMVVGFVNSGMMKVVQGIGIIMGANIGTSITGWILCLSDIQGAGGVAALLSSSSIAAIVAIVGLFVRNLSKKETHKAIGDIMFGFTILMIGMSTMKEAMAPLQNNPFFMGMLTKFSNPFLGILLGIIITAVLQSASASVGILQSVAMSGYLPFSAALPIVMGIGVGAACPVLMSGMSSNKNGKRTALVYLFNDLAGMVICGTLFYAIQAVVTRGGQFTFMDLEMKSVSIALLNTIYRTVTIIILAPFIKQINKLMFWIIKDSPDDVEDQADFDLLEERFLAYPALAITQSHAAMNGMAKKARKNILRAMSLMEEFSAEKFNKVQEKENLIDKYEDKLGTYLMQMTTHEMNANQAKQVSKFLHTVSDFERLGDHAVNVSEVAEELNEKKISFSDEASYELSVLEGAVKECVSLAVDAFCTDDLEMAAKVEPLRELIGLLCDELKLRHIARLRTGKCEMKQGFAFNDMLTNLERMAAHCSNIAVAMIEIEAADFDTHQYLKSVRERKNEMYQMYFDEYERKYDINGYRKKKEGK